MRGRIALVAAVLTLTASAATSRAAEKVWSGLVIANNAPQPHPPPPQLGRLEKTLVDLFGYNQFEVIGESSKTLKTGEEDWLAVSKYFSLHVDARGVSESGYELNLTLFQDKQVLLETETKLSKQSPLVIKGPQVGSGQLLLVLVIDSEAREQTGEHHARKNRQQASGSVANTLRRIGRVVRNVFP
jgi:hypothetical protein